MHQLHHKPFSAPPLNVVSKNVIITTLLKYTDSCLWQTGKLATAALREVMTKSTSAEKYAGT
jgi:CRISPR/Cas system endoribonuclease Cas6 (RAMP superfamily)